MLTADFVELFVKQWANAVKTHLDLLEPDDERQVTACSNWDEVQQYIVQSPSQYQQIAVLGSVLQHLKSFLSFVSRQAADRVDTKVLWGLVKLLIAVAQVEDGAMQVIPRLLRELCRKLEILNNYCSDPILLTQKTETCFEVALSVLNFASSMLQFMRNDFHLMVDEDGFATDETWQPLKQQSSAMMGEIDGLMSRIEKMSSFMDKPERTATSPLSHFRSLSMSNESAISPLMEEQARLPCTILPSSRVNRFFDRTEAVEQIERFFSKAHVSQDDFASLAIYGLGGVGKSSVALRYAETKLRRDELDALFWVQSEKDVTISQSFTDIAMELQLPEARPNDPKKNRLLVLKWLQQTKCRWLIIYDNAESVDLLSSYWPVASGGQALITTRNHSFAFSPASGGLELTSWDVETGSKFLLHLLLTDITEQISTADDSKSMLELSNMLSGHALAISHMAGVIHSRGWSINEFMELYKKHPRKMHGVSGNSSIDALWDFTFRSLDSQSFELLGILCFLSPDSIPQEFFVDADRDQLPESLNFCGDLFLFSDTVGKLLTLALIKKNKNTRTLSLHRLVQTSFKFFMTPEQKQRTFNNASLLVSLAFPRRDSNSAVLYQKWKRCAICLPHILSLKDCFLEERKADPKFGVLQTYVDMNNACQRYLIEKMANSDLGALINANAQALETLPLEEQTIHLQGPVTSHRGQWLIHIGKAPEAVEWLVRSYNIRAQLVPLDLRESGWAASNTCHGFATVNDFASAVTWFEKSCSHWRQWLQENSQDPSAMPATLKIHLSRALVWTGHDSQAHNLLNEALAQIDRTEAYDWAFAAYAHFYRGTLERRVRQWDAAESSFVSALNLWLKGDENMRSHPFNGACLHRLGCVALDQGRVEAAVRHLRDALVVTGMHAENMVAEHARSLFKLAEALEQDPREKAEAERLRDEAERLLRVRDPNVKEPGLEKTYDELISVSWR